MLCITETIHNPNLFAHTQLTNLASPAGFWISNPRSESNSGPDFFTCVVDMVEQGALVARDVLVLNSLVIGHSGSIGGTSAPRRRSTSVPADVQPRVESMRGRIRASRDQITPICYPLVCLWKRQTVDVQLSWRHLVPFRSCDCIRASDVRKCVWILPKMRQINQCSLTRLMTRATAPEWFTSRAVQSSNASNKAMFADPSDNQSNATTTPVSGSRVRAAGSLVFGWHGGQ
jgi:hypothetical protein